MTLRAIAPAIVLAAAGGVASAAQYEWNWTRGGPGTGGLNDSAGQFQSVNASYDTSSRRFTWEVSFNDTLTQGLTLAVNNGPNPKGHAGELALLYIDARNTAAPTMLAYAYNGQNSSNSWQDGNGPQAGTQAADKIDSTLFRTDWIENLEVVDIAGKRTIRFAIDATRINTHTPMYPDAIDPWTGIGFGDKIGLWMHTYRGLNATYDGAGYLTGWSRQGEGWFDGANFGTTLVPTPMAAGLAGLGLACVAAGRRRRA